MDEPGELLERQGELALANGLLERSEAGNGGVLAIEGAPGIGKTRLLDEVVGMARSSGFAVLRARGVQLEQEHPFGLVRQLLTRAARDAAGQQPTDASALAERVFSRDAAIPFEPMPPHRFFATLHGLYWMCAERAAVAPLLLAVDDTHWGDTGSLAFLAYYARRLEGVRSLLVFTRRPVEPGASVGPVDALPIEGFAATCELPALSQPATTRLVEGVLGMPASPEFASECYWATRGNPFLVRELTTELLRERVAPIPEEAVRVRQLGAPNVTRMTKARLRRIGPNALALAHAVATLDRDASLAIAAELAGLDLDTAAEIADRLAETNILDSIDPLTFAHPLVRNAVYAGVPPAHRASSHRQAAAILTRAGVGYERVSDHLLKSEPQQDPWTVKQLRRGAASAIARAAPLSAVSYLQRALLEPPARSDRSGLLLALGQTEALVGHASCTERLQEAITVADDALIRGRAALALSQILTFQGEIASSVALLERAVRDFDSAGATDLALAAEAEIANNSLLDTRTAGVARGAAQRIEARLQDDLGPGSRPAYSSLACLAAISGERSDEVAILASRALESPPGEDDDGDSPVHYVVAFALMFVDRFTEAKAALEAEVTAAQARGSALGLVGTRIVRSHLHFRLGAIFEAEADAAYAFEEHLPLPPAMLSLASAFYGDALLAEGRLVEASSVIESFPIAAESSGALAHALHTRARTRAARGLIQDAISDLQDCGRRMTAIASENPGTIPWRSTLAELLAEQGERREALELARAEVQLAARIRGSRALGVALLAQAHCCRGPKALRLLDHAIRILRPSPARLDYARALIRLGIELCRLNRRVDARDPLRMGLDLAHRCGAAVLADEARAQLIVAGARPRREVLSGIRSLTPSELRVARLAAEGLTNAQVAQALFVTRKTVETHLSNVYAKLCVAGRENLSEVLASEW